MQRLPAWPTPACPHGWLSNFAHSSTPARASLSSGPQESPGNSPSRSQSASDHDALVAAFRKEIADFGIDVILDYLWGPPAEAVLAAISQKGLSHAASRIRYVDIGESAGPTITLGASTLRSSGLELLGSGFGSASMKQIFEALAEFFSSAAKEPFQIAIKTAP